MLMHDYILQKWVLSKYLQAGSGYIPVISAKFTSCCFTVLGIPNGFILTEKSRWFSSMFSVMDFQEKVVVLFSILFSSFAFCHYNSTIKNKSEDILLGFTTGIQKRQFILNYSPNTCECD